MSSPKHLQTLTTFTQYNGTGTYKIRLRRYTSGGGNTASVVNDSAFLPKIFIGIGVVFIILCGIVIFYPTIKKLIKRKLNEWQNNNLYNPI